MVKATHRFRKWFLQAQEGAQLPWTQKGNQVSVRLTTTVVFRCRPGSTNTERFLSGALAIRLLELPPWSLVSPFGFLPSSQGENSTYLDLWSGVHGLVVSGDDPNQTEGDGDVADPVEGSPWKQQLQEGPADLTQTQTKQDNRNGQSDSHQDGQSDTQDQSVQGVHLTLPMAQNHKIGPKIPPTPLHLQLDRQITPHPLHLQLDRQIPPTLSTCSWTDRYPPHLSTCSWTDRYPPPPSPPAAGQTDNPHPSTCSWTDRYPPPHLSTCS
ncbi:hypothetical protein F7725_000081 [Dissostichus mawsoni]|uniref:Uncharacterized protein n=1 Tax=Dissostichus mawsoni TaxID=36200 RepID=A0A7J5ZDX2_DISMA|nr:hypothetical protein F7725_000081 [Dissostichus mawsoni]